MKTPQHYCLMSMGKKLLIRLKEAKIDIFKYFFSDEKFDVS